MNHHAYMGQSANINTNTNNTPLQSNRYHNSSNMAYQHIPNSKRLPQTIINQQQPSPSNHNKPYLQRNQSFQNRQYNQQLIQLIAKIRSLQDDLLNQRFKNQSLQRKILQNSRIIDNLQYQLNKQSYQLQKYIHQIQLSNEKNIEILKYEQNLKIVGEEIQQLNDILVRRNEEYDAVCGENRQLVGEINKLIEESNLMNIRVGMWMKEVDALVDEHRGYMVERGIVRENKMSSNGVQRLGKINSNNNMPINITGNNPNGLLKIPSPTKYPTQLSPSNNNNNQSFHPNINDSMTFKQQNQSTSFLPFDPTNNNPTIQMGKKLQLIKSLCQTLSSQIQSNNNSYQKQRISLQQQLMTEKQKYIKLQYEHKLLQQRIKDSDKKKDIIEKHYQDMRTQQQLNQMIKNEDQYIGKIQQLMRQNQQLKEELEGLQQAQQYIQQVSGQQREGIVRAMEREKELLEETINELTVQLDQVKERLREMEQQCQLLLSQKEQLILDHNEQATKSGKKIRKLQQDNYQNQIRIEQLNGELTLLKRELDIINKSCQQGQLEQKRQ